MPPEKRRFDQPEIFIPTKKAKSSAAFEDLSISLGSGVDDLQLERKAGSIFRIQLVNFMVHQQFDYYPGPRVNMITGRNGSGKSSVLQAIVIGLGKSSAFFLLLVAILRDFTLIILRRESVRHEAQQQFEALCANWNIQGGNSHPFVQWRSRGLPAGKIRGKDHF